jgi:ABC-2 type transport system permease protein
MNLTHIHALVLRQWYLVRDNKYRLFQIFGWSIFDILLWGFISKFLTTVSAETIQFAPIFLGAIVVWHFIIRVMHGVTTAFFEDLWTHNFLNIFASPITLGEYLMSLVLTGIVTAVVGLLFMMVLVWVLFGFSIFVYGWYLIPFLIILFATGVALGMVSTAIVLRFGPSSEWFIWSIPEVVAPFVGVFYPLAILPMWMQIFAVFLPPSYVFESIRTLVVGGPISPSSLLVGFVLSVLYCWLAYWFFARTFRMAVQTGLIARYGAESIES